MDGYRCPFTSHLQKISPPVGLSPCSRTLSLLILDRKLPWSILVPLKFFFLFAGAPPSNLYQAGLLTPLSVSIGLICVIVYDEAIPVVPRGRILGEIQSPGNSHV